MPPRIPNNGVLIPWVALAAGFWAALIATPDTPRPAPMSTSINNFTNVDVAVTCCATKQPSSLFTLLRNALFQELLQYMLPILKSLVQWMKQFWHRQKEQKRTSASMAATDGTEPAEASMQIPPTSANLPGAQETAVLDAVQEAATSTQTMHSQLSNAPAPERISSLLSEIISQLTCDICYRPYRRPVLLHPCLHRFCNGCANNTRAADEEEGRDPDRCPTCRGEVEHVSENDILVRHLLVDLKTAGLIETSEDDETEPNSEATLAELFVAQEEADEPTWYHPVHDYPTVTNFAPIALPLYQHSTMGEVGHHTDSEQFQAIGEDDDSPNSFDDDTWYVKSDEGDLNETSDDNDDAGSSNHG